jgi:hypothetical protein
MNLSHGTPQNQNYDFRENGYKITKQPTNKLSGLIPRANYTERSPLVG